jgi:hypothetical protein
MTLDGDGGDSHEGTSHQPAPPARLTAAAFAVAASLQLAPSALANHVQPGYNPGQVNPDYQQRWATPSPDDRAWVVRRPLPERAGGDAQPVQFLNYHWPRGENWGIYNCRLPSLHSEGRAVDFHLEANDAGDKAAADAISYFFRRSDSGGVEVGDGPPVRDPGDHLGTADLDGRPGEGRVARYSVCDPSSSSYSSSRTAQHKDHIHIGQNWKGANRATTAWTGYH